ncbi:response regulator transcription factor [Opitutales bacterium ASA1]|jgi:DNA-binding NarL/FixJ family response regulator|uniref:response regulator n=1 Tax=Congregicoccus parvus TaxID=3081749 RepID=UPI002B2F7EF8|nr:response regulator transcription factor [Opitutales bacterium ASA1]
MKRVVIVEDQTAIREMLVEILRHESGYEVVGQAGDGQTGLALVIDTRPDILILDARLPVLNGLELLRRATRVLRHLRILVFSGHENPVLIREMLEAGAHGFVEKTAGLSELRKGLDSIAAGGTYFGPTVSSLLRNVVANPSVTSNSKDFLTPREREILQLVAESYSTKEIAQRLGISVKTVDNHRTNLMRKLDLHNVASITRYAMQVGLIENQPSV